MNENIIWTVEAIIKEGQREAFDAVMIDLIEATSEEDGIMNYEWTIAKDGKSIHIYERYLNADAAMIHAATWGANAERFMSAADITRFTVFCELTSELKEIVSPMDPVYMKPFGGFVK